MDSQLPKKVNWKFQKALRPWKPKKISYNTNNYNNKFKIIISIIFIRVLLWLACVHDVHDAHAYVH